MDTLFAKGGPGVYSLFTLTLNSIYVENLDLYVCFNQYNNLDSDEILFRFIDDWITYEVSSYSFLSMQK